jgi:hypothetical protein
MHTYPQELISDYSIVYPEVNLEGHNLLPDLHLLSLVGTELGQLPLDGVEHLGDEVGRQLEVLGRPLREAYDLRVGVAWVPGEGVPVALAVHLDVDAYRHQVIPRRPAARPRRRRRSGGGDAEATLPREGQGRGGDDVHAELDRRRPGGAEAHRLHLPRRAAAGSSSVRAGGVAGDVAARIPFFFLVFFFFSEMRAS